MPAFFHIGIDISKMTLDIAVLKEGALLLTYKIDNKENALKEFLVLLRNHHHLTSENAIFCAEHMGIYADFLRNVLTQKNMRLCLESPLHIKLSMGIQRSKSDVLDAIRIAQYAYKNSADLRFWKPPRPPVQQLRTLTAIRKRLVKIAAMLKSPKKLEKYYLSEFNRKSLGDYSKATFSAIKQDLKVVNAAIKATFHSDPQLQNLLDIITSVPNVGIVIATELVIITNEFKEINCPKKFASYCGIAPFAKNSGTTLKRRPRISPIANKELKTILHLASLGATRTKHSRFRDYYDRKVAEGKNKMSVLNAVRNKIVAVIFACVRENRLYEET